MEAGKRIKKTELTSIFLLEDTKMHETESRKVMSRLWTNKEGKAISSLGVRAGVSPSGKIHLNFNLSVRIDTRFLWNLRK